CGNYGYITSSIAVGGRSFPRSAASLSLLPARSSRRIGP
ncbi:MAG: hypothetical protein AVDCRST_MAG26-3004, partial [uncultured Chloroflexia bacterium]